jgi:SAM-dependent methyltransferase
MTEREAGVERLYPKLLGRMGARYYYLIELRKQIEAVVHQFIKPQHNKLTLADYGCGNKPYEPLVAPFVERYVGIDLPQNPVADVHVSPRGRIELNDQSLDAVLSTQVLEHVENPTHYLAEAHRVLKADGLLILTTHGYWMFHPDPTDFWRWTSTGLQKVVIEAGFEVVYFQGIIGRAAMGLQLFQDGLLFKVPAILRPLLALFFQPQIMLFDKLFSTEARNRDACTYVVVARKK